MLAENHDDEIWAIIPARGGSKGIPRKNLQVVAGLSLIERAIRAAQRAPSINRVIVTTDDAEIAEHSQRAGATVVVRPADLASDTASSEAALLHALTEMRKILRFAPRILVFMQCTSPFVSSGDVEGVIARLHLLHADSALTVCASHGFLWKDPDNAHGINHDKSFRKRRQDLEPEYLETGAVYAMKTSGFVSTRHRFFGKTVLYETPVERALEIDSPVDLEIARTMAPYIEPRS